MKGLRLRLVIPCVLLFLAGCGSEEGTGEVPSTTDPALQDACDALTFTQESTEPLSQMEFANVTQPLLDLLRFNSGNTRLAVIESNEDGQTQTLNAVPITLAVDDKGTDTADDDDIVVRAPLPPDLETPYQGGSLTLRLEGSAFRCNPVSADVDGLPMADDPQAVIDTIANSLEGWLEDMAGIYGLSLEQLRTDRESFAGSDSGDGEPVGVVALYFADAILARIEKVLDPNQDPALTDADRKLLASLFKQAGESGYDAALFSLANDIDTEVSALASTPQTGSPELGEEDPQPGSLNGCPTTNLTAVDIDETLELERFMQLQKVADDFAAPELDLLRAGASLALGWVAAIDPDTSDAASDADVQAAAGILALQELLLSYTRNTFPSSLAALRFSFINPNTDAPFEPENVVSEDFDATPRWEDAFVNADSRRWGIGKDETTLRSFLSAVPTGWLAGIATLDNDAKSALTDEFDRLVNLFDPLLAPIADIEETEDTTEDNCFIFRQALWQDFDVTSEEFTISSIVNLPDGDDAPDSGDCADNDATSVCLGSRDPMGQDLPIQRTGNTTVGLQTDDTDADGDPARFAGRLEFESNILVVERIALNFDPTETNVTEPGNSVGFKITVQGAQDPCDPLPTLSDGGAGGSFGGQSCTIDSDNPRNARIDVTYTSPDDAAAFPVSVTATRNSPVPDQNGDTARTANATVTNN